MFGEKKHRDEAPDRQDKDTGVAALTGSAGDYNWGGAYGTGFWVDPKPSA